MARSARAESAVGKGLTPPGDAPYITRHAMGTSMRTGFFYFYFTPESAHRL